MKKLLLPLFLALGFAVAFLHAQSPTPDVVVQAASSASSGQQTAPTKVLTGAGDMKEILQAALEMKATNDATLKKQQAALATLDELQKAAEELKIFSKRG